MVYAVGVQAPATIDRHRLVRILGWNILHGGSSRRLPRIALELVSHDPDVVVITEFRRTLGGQVLGVLADRGLVHVAEAGEPGRGNRTAIVSRFAMDRGAGLDRVTMPECLSRRVLVRRIVVDADDAFILTAAHLPDDWTPSNALTGWAWLVGHAIGVKDDRHAIVGDLNGSRDAGQAGGTPRHVAHAMGRLWTAGYRDAFLEGGWSKDVDFGPETTWKSHWGHELRLDHAILSASLTPRLVGAKYSHSPRMEGVSDHSAVLVDLRREGGTADATREKIGKNHEKTGIEPMFRTCQTASGAIESRGSRRESSNFME